MTTEQEIKEFLKGNWMAILITIAVFAFICVIYPYTDMGRQQTKEQREQAVSLIKAGILNPDEKDAMMQEYGLTEDDLNPLRRYLEKTY